MEYDRIKLECEKCGKEYDISYSGYNKNKRNNTKFYCHDCRIQQRSELMKIRNANRTEEEKEKQRKAASEYKKKYWEEMSKEEKDQRISVLSQQAQEWHKTATPEEKQRVSETHSESNKRRWENMSDEEKENYRRKSIERWESLSDEEKEKHRQRSIDNWSNLTFEEYNEICEAISNSKKEYWENLSDEDRKNISNKISNSVKEFWNSLDDWEKEEFSNRIKDGISNMSEEAKDSMNFNRSESLKKYWNSMSEEERKAINPNLINASKEYWENLSEKDRELISKRNKEWWESLSNDERKEYTSRLSEVNKQYWNNLSQEDKDKKVSQLNNGFREWFDNLSEEELLDFSNSMKAISNNFWENATEEVLINRSKKLSEIGKNQWNSLSEEEKINHINNLKEYSKNWWENITEEDRKRISEKISKKVKSWIELLSEEEKIERNKRLSSSIKNWYDNLTTEERIELQKKKLLPSQGNNKLHQKFERAFEESHLVNEFRLVPECVTSNNDIVKSWDYGIFNKETNKLEMVVDLDGEYFHADKYDYDGLRSKEEYDERRGLSVPDGVKPFIILEKKFFKCFELMLQVLMKNYNDYVKFMFYMCRNMPFPEPKFDDKILINTFKQLKNIDCDSKYYQNISMNSRVGDRLINHFHSSILRAKRGDSELSPYEAWYDDKLLIEVIKNRIVYQTYLNPYKILQGFNIAKKAQKVSVFSAARAKLIINKYLKEFDTVFDPFSGFSGRMLGTISLGKRYIGQDINPIHVRESKEMISFLSDSGFNINASIIEKDIFESSGDYDCLFTCSPYSNKEKWMDMEVKDLTCDEWIDECLKRFKCKRYVFVVDTTKKYEKYVVGKVSNMGHMSKNSELLLVIDSE